MSGRLVVDGAAGVDDLMYSSNRELAGWDRFRIRFVDGGDLRMRDPRRLGAVELDPDETRLGPDARGISAQDLAGVLGSSNAPVKARIMDQARLAGVGNLIADEVSVARGIDPRRAASSLAGPERRRLHKHLRKTIEDFLTGGGSHTGDLLAAPHHRRRLPQGRHTTTPGHVGGRTTCWCPRHQL